MGVPKSVLCTPPPLEVCLCTWIKNVPLSEPLNENFTQDAPLSKQDCEGYHKHSSSEITFLRYTFWCSEFVFKIYKLLKKSIFGSFFTFMKGRHKKLTKKTPKVNNLSKLRIFVTSKAHISAKNGHIVTILLSEHSPNTLVPQKKISWWYQSYKPLCTFSCEKKKQKWTPWGRR